MNYLLRFVTAAALWLLPLAAIASQNTLWSPVTGTVSGLQLTNTYNNAIDSVNGCNSGNSAPTNQLSGSPSLGVCWLNTSTSPPQFETYDGTSWTIVGYLDTTNHVYSPALNGGAGGSIASASSINLCSVSTPYVTVTGTTGITSFGSSCPIGTVKWVTFSGVSLTLTYNATSMILPTAGSNLATAAGDVAEFIHLGSGNWKALNYTKANGQITGASSSKVLLATYTPSGVASQSDTTSLTGTYSEYEIDIEVLIPSSGAGVQLLMQVYSGGLQTSSYTYEQLYGSTNSPGAFGGASASAIPLVPANTVPNTTGTGVSCRIFVSNPAGSGSYKVFNDTCQILNVSQALTYVGGGVWYGGTNAVTGISLAFSSGNIASGTIKIYGWN